PPGFVEKTYEFLDYFLPQVDEYNNLLTFNKIFIERTADVGILTPGVAVNYGVTGPNLRGSGVKWDLRKDEAYSIYDQFDFAIPVGTGIKGSVGDCWDRYWVRAEEMRESVKIIRQALDQMPRDGDVREAVPRRIRPPKGAIYSRSETPRGELGFYIISDGKPKPTRLKMRSPAFTALSVLSEISQGWMISDVLAILGSLDIV
ncbi:MAG: NADH-quinone oxidoreductase subunit D, partial [Planctomycetes bacterium]|nr:NADH-quinone oxidoreductase subunit D [Planctomycetota bacterium]